MRPRAVTRDANANAWRSRGPQPRILSGYVPMPPRCSAPSFMISVVAATGNSSTPWSRRWATARSRRRSSATWRTAQTRRPRAPPWPGTGPGRRWCTTGRPTGSNSSRPPTARRRGTTWQICASGTRMPACGLSSLAMTLRCGSRSRWASHSTLPRIQPSYCRASSTPGRSPRPALTGTSASCALKPSDPAPPSPVGPALSGYPPPSRRSSRSRRLVSEVPAGDFRRTHRVVWPLTWPTSMEVAQI